MNRLRFIALLGLFFYNISTSISERLLLNNFAYDLDSKEFTLTTKNGKKATLTGQLGIGRSEIKLVTHNSTTHQITFESSIRLDIKSTPISDDITCTHHQWSSPHISTQYEDCFSLNTSYWYGGSEMYDQQLWPINDQVIDSYTPYLTGLYNGASSVMERYWLASSGIAIVVNQSAPLFLLKNRTHICFLAKAGQWPYEEFAADFSYDICQADSSANPTSYMNQLHLHVINSYFARPKNTPDELMFARPIWSTWAYYKKLIDQAELMKFARAILANNFTHSQLEIDDKWQTIYGDFEFERIKFPNMSETVSELNKLGFRTTLWVHPFANLRSDSYAILSNNMLAVSDRQS